MGLDRNEATALSRMFSATVFRQLGQHAASPLLARLLPLTSVPACVPNAGTVGDALTRAFDLLRHSDQRDDYVYRSALVLKRLLGRHNLRTATMLNEVRIGSRKADMIMLNGTATAYEIKSDRDSLARLPEQIRAYREVFGSVIVVTNRNYLQRVQNMVPKDVGMIELTCRYTLRVVRQVQDQPWRVDPLRVLDVLRIPEARAVLQNLGHETPDVPNTMIRSEMARVFKTLDAVEVHRQMTHVLRRNRSQAHLEPFIQALPNSLRTGSLTTQPNSRSQEMLRIAIQTPLDEALTWT